MSTKKKFKKKVKKSKTNVKKKGKSKVKTLSMAKKPRVVTLKSISAMESVYDSKAPREKPSTSFAMLSYLVQLFNMMLLGSGVILSLVIYFVAGKRFTKFHALQASFIGFVISLLTYILKDSISNGTPVIDILNYPLLYPLFGAAIVIVLLLLALKAYKNEWIELPLFGKLAMKFI